MVWNWSYTYGIYISKALNGQDDEVKTIKRSENKSKSTNNNELEAHLL